MNDLKPAWNFSTQALSVTDEQDRDALARSQERSLEDRIWGSVTPESVERNGGERSQSDLAAPYSAGVAEASPATSLSTRENTTLPR